MEQSTDSASGVAPLQSKDHRDLLDIVDKLRSQGIKKDGGWKTPIVGRAVCDSA
jgi:hypothetical protein